ncbi:ComEA family DNA-binding protein [Haliea sp. E17]|uniref:ComEA family DNA-binding protein n=1 Tax=Haliea sp. E17 TaxID=3401576 RepID=UPI003AABA757
MNTNRLVNTKADSGRTVSGRLFAVLVLLCSLSLLPVQAVYAETAQETASVVNINVADAKALATALKGVGLSRAEDIVKYREEYGPFTTVEQLAEVRGIGLATVEKNRDRITLE